MAKFYSEPVKILLIDNFDSFTYNLVHAFQALGADVRVMRHHASSVRECLALRPGVVVIGPGPGKPENAGISTDLIRACAGQIPVFGVCLGHQCLAEVFGGNVVKGKRPMHGKTSPISHKEKGVFYGMPNRFLATRYHSLVVDRHTLPSCLEVTAETDEREIMGLKHVSYPMESIQFHPESVQTTGGLQLLKNFLSGEGSC